MEQGVRSGSARWLWIALFVVATSAVLAGGYTYYQTETERIRQEKHRELAAIGTLKVGQIEQWRQERLSDVRRSVKAPFFGRALREWLRDRSNSALQARLHDRLVVERREQGYADVLLLDLDGQILLSAEPEPHPLSPSTKQVINQAVADRTAMLSDLYRCPQGFVHLDAVAPILGEDGRPLAALVLRSNAETHLYPLIQSWPTPSRTAETLLVRRDGDGVLFLNELRHVQNTALSLREPLTLHNLPAVQAVLGKEGIFRGEDYREVEVLADLRPVAGSPWFMVAKVDAAEILAEARYRGGIVALFAVLFIALAAGGTAYLYRHRQVRLYRELYRSEHEQRAALSEFRTTLYSIGDAVITTDTYGLVKQMNHVAERLTGWIEAEATGKPLDTIFHIVNEESRDVVENPVQRVLREGIVVGLANHTLLITKDGAEHPIADSGAPIRDENDAIIGVVLVFRDQTEERGAQESVRAVSSRLEAILASVPDIIMQVDTDKVYTWANPAGIAFFGEDVLGKEASYYFESEQETYETVAPLFRGEEEVFYVESWQRRRDGEKRLLAWWCRALKDGSGNVIGALSTARDITEAHLAVQSLANERAHLRTLVQTIPDLVWLKDPEGVYITCNPVFEGLYGAKEADIVGKTDYDFVDAELADFFRRKDREAVAAGHPTANEEWLTFADDGHRALFETIKTPMLDAQGRLVGVLGIARDIMALRHAEEVLREKTRLTEILLDSMPCVALLLRPHTREIVASNKAARQVGAVVGARCFSTWAQRSDPCPWCLAPKLWETGEAQHQEVEALGIVFDAHWIPIAPDLYMHYAFDITERKRAEECLRKSEQRYRSLFDNMLEGVAYCRMVFEDGNPQDFVYIDVNDAFERLTGLKNVIGKKATEVIAGIREASPALFEVYGRVALTGNPEKLETYVELLGIWFSLSVYSTEREHFVAVFDNITERKQAEEALKESQARVRMKLDSILSPEGDISNLDLADVIDTAAIQSLMDAFYNLTRIPVGIIDLSGKILVATGWQEICTTFHRSHPETCQYCIESDTVLTRDLEPGSFRLYRCKNNMWDLATPIIVGEKHLGNLFLGQFLFEDEEPDRKAFQSQARRYGFDEQAYLAALENVPRWSREMVEGAMTFYGRLAEILSTQSYGNIKLARSLAERERLVSAIEQAAEAVVITDVEGTIHYVNPAFESITGYTREEAIGRNPRILKSGEHDDAFYQQLWDTIQGGDTWSGRLINRRKDGRLFHEEATISPVKDPSGKITDFVAVKRDITEHLELSRQLSQAQKMEAVGTLAGGVAHDFNNLLQVVLGYSELVLSDEHLPAVYRADLERINHAARNGADLVQRLLTFSRKTEVKPRPLNLNRRIEQFQKMLSRTIPKMIRIRLVLAGDLAAINADPTQIEQILMNLAVNARDAMPEGGRLTIQTENATLEEHYARTHLGAMPGPYVLLTVSDTGQGMDKGTVQHIFEPFFTTKGPGEGTGLGLAMVYGIVQQHGGYIMCYSEPDKGTAFKMYFPALVSEEESRQPETTVLPRGGSETILLVDDEELIRDLGVRILTRAGYQVIVASNGKKGLEEYQARRDEISLVILDLIMPEMGGKQCLEGLLGLNPAVKVLIASGYSTDGTTEAVTWGAKGFVHKPYDMRQVLETVRAVLDEETAVT
ncbi:MAG: PAS domain S-box protein [Desulfomonile tiedjei]|nr:PAS domain S-box protein [Desulfomonile tiedjei]